MVAIRRGGEMDKDPAMCISSEQLDQMIMKRFPE
jgi:hypothetical protein